MIDFSSFYCETHKTMSTRNIYGMLLCCEKLANKARDNKVIKPQTAEVISLRFACIYPELYCDWPVHNQHS